MITRVLSQTLSLFLPKVKIGSLKASHALLRKVGLISDSSSNAGPSGHEVRTFL